MRSPTQMYRICQFRLGLRAAVLLVTVALGVAGCGEPASRPVPCESTTPPKPGAAPSPMPLFVQHAEADPTLDLRGEWARTVAVLRPAAGETAAASTEITPPVRDRAHP